MLISAKIVPMVPFLRYFVENLRNPKIFDVACHKLSQIDVTKTLRSFQPFIIVLSSDLEYLFKPIGQKQRPKTKLVPIISIEFLFYFDPPFF